MIYRRTPIKRRQSRIPARRATPRRTTAERNEAYKEYIRGMKCLVCLNLHGQAATPRGSEPHHIFPLGMGVKCDDTKTVPLCCQHHNEVESRGRKDFEAKYGVNLEREALAYLGIWLLKQENERTEGGDK